MSTRGAECSVAAPRSATPRGPTAPMISHCVPGPRRRARFLRGWHAGLLVLVLCACRRALADWQEDLRSTDPWRRRMAALALGRVEDKACEPAFRSLVIHLRDGDPEVIAGIEDSLRALSRRRSELPVQAIKAFPVERMRHRSFLAGILVELERAGHAEVREALDQYVANELASGFEPRVEAARRLQREREAGGRTPG